MNQFTGGLQRRLKSALSFGNVAHGAEHIGILVLRDHLFVVHFGLFNAFEKVIDGRHAAANLGPR